MNILARYHVGSGRGRKRSCTDRVLWLGGCPTVPVGGEVPALKRSPGPGVCSVRGVEEKFKEMTFEYRVRKETTRGQCSG